MDPFKTNTYSEYLPTQLSLTFEEMQQIHADLLRGIGSDADAIDLYEDLYDQAIKYINYRAKWSIWSRQKKLDNDNYRTSCHNSLITKCNILARYQKAQGHSITWRELLGDENTNPYARKRIGDFACYLVFVNAINER